MSANDSGMSATAVIPARGGSKGIPRKNLVDLGGTPLIAWTIRAARAASEIDRVIVNTDDEEIAAISMELGAEIHRRKHALAEDSVHASKVVLDSLGTIGDADAIDAVLMLLPTCPFRTPTQIDQAVRTLRCSEPDATVIGVSRVGRHLGNLRYVTAGRLAPLDNGDPNRQRQSFPELYAVNGAIFAARPSTLCATETFHGADARALIMSRQSSIDVDTPEDLAWAREMLAAGFVRDEEAR
jgi:CMP-N-acetylneuraminic acid synthetase